MRALHARPTHPLLNGSRWRSTPAHMHPHVFALEQLRGKHLLRGMQPDSTRDARAPLPSPSTLQGQRLACAALCFSSPWLLPVVPPSPLLLAPRTLLHASLPRPLQVLVASLPLWLACFPLESSLPHPDPATRGHVITDDGASRSGVRRVP